VWLRIDLFHILSKGGYFIINGSEKVLIAQERMAANHVYVFAKAQPSPISFLAEVRSAVEKGGKTISTMQVKMFHRNPQKTVSSHPRVCTASAQALP
jgi:DNA-directed RNA polymerase II subunit RPB2